MEMPEDMRKVSESMTKETSEILVEKMQEQDIPQVAEIEAKVFSMPWSKQGFADALKQDTIFVTAKQGGKILGYCGMYCSFEEGEITNVAVLPEAQKQGIGEKIIAGLLQAARQQNITRIILEVRVSNNPAIHLYEDFGFQKVGIRKGFYEKPREDAAIMVLEQIPSSHSDCEPPIIEV